MDVFFCKLRAAVVNCRSKFADNGGTTFTERESEASFVNFYWESSNELKLTMPECEPEAVHSPFIVRILERKSLFEGMSRMGGSV